MSVRNFLKEHKALAAGWIAAISLIVLSGTIFVLYYIKNRDTEKARDISAEIMSIEKGDLTYNDIYGEVIILADSEEMEEKLDRLFDPLYMSDKVNVSCVRKLAELIGSPKSVYSDILKNRDETQTVSREEFDRIYLNILENSDIPGIERTVVYIDSVNKEEDNIVISDGYDEYPCLIDKLDEAYKGNIVEAYSRDGYIFKIIGFSDKSFNIRNVYVYDVDDTFCRFLFGESERRMKIKEGTKVVPDRFCDIVFTNEGVSGQIFCPNSIRGRALSINENRIRLSKRAWLNLDEKMQVYDISSDKPAKPKSLKQLVGYREIRLVMSYDDTVQGIIIEDPEIAYEEIRVLLNENGYTDYAMEEVKVVAEKPILMEVGTEDVIPSVIDPGKEVTFKKKDYPVGTVITLRTEDEEGRIRLCNLERGYGQPDYRGYIEITCEEDGLYVVNGLSIEEYLYGVVSSELPNSFDVEAQKALAVCARGYAYNHIEDGTYAAHGANLDDTVMCQVYNNYQENETAVTAVDDTYGVVMTYDGYVIMAYYFSTSAGVTCNNAEIWNEESEPYLTDNIETIDKPIADLSAEEDFISFISGIDEDAIEKDMSFYRWNIAFTDKEMTETVARNLPERLEKSTDWIQVMTAPDTFSYDENLKTVGNVTDIQVTSRSRGGVIQEMQITGTEATIRVKGQSNILGLITPEKVSIVTASGTEQKGWNTLPSPTYYVEKTAKGFTIHGGGFGHGCGMSQYGADILAKEGYDYRYILMHYYNDIKFDNIYSKMLESEEQTATVTDAEE